MTESTELTKRTMHAEDSVHKIFLDGRRALRMTGVCDVDSYDEHVLTVRTTQGILTLEGTGFHVKRLSLEDGELLLDGEISALYYEDDLHSSAQGGFFSRLFR